jgi:hypothetical protein
MGPKNLFESDPGASIFFSPSRPQLTPKQPYFLSAAAEMKTRSRCQFAPGWLDFATRGMVNDLSTDHRHEHLRVGDLHWRDLK